MANRFRNCQDVWTGEPLRGKDMLQWLRLIVGLGEDDKGHWGHSLRSIDQIHWEGDLVTISCTFDTRNGPTHKTIVVEYREDDGERDVRLVS